MHLTCFGAVREVTGSLHMLSTDSDRILLDCGLFQGRRKEAAQKNRDLPVDPAAITNIVLSHAHIDHSGRLPLLTRNGFTGRIISTRATKDACGYLLPDSAHIQESDALYLNYKTVRAALSHDRNGKLAKRQESEAKKMLKRNHHKLDPEAIDRWIDSLHLEAVRPLYTQQDADIALSCFDGYPYRTPITIGKKMTCTFYEAGHILGSAVSVIHAAENGRKSTLCYTGDLGRFDKPILKDPVLNFLDTDREIDLLLMESTYGDREHEPVVDLKPRLREVLQETMDRRGSVLIPSFAYGRTQELLYVIHELYAEGSVRRIPVYVDSPLATNITRVFGEHPEVYDQETHKTFLRNGLNPFIFDQVQYIESVEDSMRLMRETKPHIVISASGMCEAGRILHHLRYKIHNPNNTILVVGYMANHTLGRRILDQGEAYEKAGRQGDPPILKFLNKTYPLKARVRKIGGFSAHADKNEMLRFLKTANLKIKKIALVHGEEEQSLSFADTLRQEGFEVTVPQAGEKIAV